VGGSRNALVARCVEWCEGPYLRLLASFITQLKAQGPSRTCNESKKKKKRARTDGACAHVWLKSGERHAWRGARIQGS